MSAVAVQRMGGTKGWNALLAEFSATYDRLHPQYVIDWSPVLSLLPNCSYDVLAAFRQGDLVGFLAFCRFDGPSGSVVQSVPWIAYGGPVSREPEVQRILLESLVDYGQATGCLALTIGTPPFQDPVELAYWREVLRPDYTTRNFCQYSMLLRHPLDQVGSKRRQAIRNEIRHAVSAGVEVDLRPASARYEEWQEIYYERYRDIGAHPYPPEFWRGIFAHVVPSGRALLATAHLNGALLGGTLLLLGRGIVDYFATAFRSEAMRLNPGALVLSECFNWLMDHKFTHFNWQSSPSRGGVYAYKARWGAAEGEVEYLTRALGDLSSVLAQPLDEVAAMYRGYFVLPFSLWDETGG